VGRPKHFKPKFRPREADETRETGERHHQQTGAHHSRDLHRRGEDSRDERSRDERPRGVRGYSKGKFGGGRPGHPKPKFRPREDREPSAYEEREGRRAETGATTRDGPVRRHPEGAAKRPSKIDGRGARAASFGAGLQRAPQNDEKQESAPASVPTSVQNVIVTADEAGMRVDRFLEAKFPGLSFSHIQRLIRKGELRVNGKRTEPKSRLSEGQTVRIPPLRLNEPRPVAGGEGAQKTRDFLKSITLYEDADVMVLNKPMGLAVQGGSGTTRHLDGMLDVLRDAHGQRPRLVHRLDKDTAGCLLVAKTRFAASALAKTFRSRAARKIYWALVAGVPKVQQGRVSTYLAKEEREEDSFMRIARHGEKGAIHAVTYYAVVETSGQLLAWLSLKPVTGRTHQLRAHMAHIGHPIVGDPKYFSLENWELPGGMQNRLHLLARRIAVPHPRGGTIDVTAPLPPHMQQSWNLLGLDATRYDPIVDSPEE
jgi:23S rRNA pseudouridine955/2504/2580 synthase